MLILEERKNLEILKRIVEDHDVIIPIEKHVKSDGNFNGDYINEVWDKSFELFIKTPLWDRKSETLKTHVKMADELVKMIRSLEKDLR